MGPPAFFCVWGRFGARSSHGTLRSARRSNGRRAQMRLNNLWVLPLALALASCNLGETRYGSFYRSLEVSGPVNLEVDSDAGSITLHDGRDSSFSVSACIRDRGPFSCMRPTTKDTTLP